MEYIVVFLAGALAAASALVIGYYGYLGVLKAMRRRLTDWDTRLSSNALALSQQAKALADYRLQTENELASKRRQTEEAIAASLAQQAANLAERKRSCDESIAVQTRDVEGRRQQLDDAIAAFEARKVTYDSIVRENAGLKQDCFNLSVRAKKMERDHAAIAQRQNEISEKSTRLAETYLKENVSWISDKLNSNNFSSCKQRLLKVVVSCRAIGFDVPEEKEQGLIKDLQSGFEQAVRAEFAREEQARIRAQIREEEKLAKERAKQVDDAEREKQNAEKDVAAMRAAVEKALKATEDEHSIEVEFYKAKLKEAEEKQREAEEKAQRAISQAQLTKSGHVYVLSNIGSFGEGVFKIGMTRRLVPHERVDELSSASVPFPFDVHMMISCNDAPSLENALHREFHRLRLNKVKPQKEFFRVDLESVRKFVESQSGEVTYLADVAEPPAEQYRQSATMPDEDADFIERTVESVMGEGEDSTFDD